MITHAVIEPSLLAWRDHPDRCQGGVANIVSVLQRVKSGGGAATRDLTRLSQALMGEGISRSTVCRVTKVLGEQIEQLRRAPIEGAIPYLYLDATFLDARWARAVENVSALVAYGVDGTGHRRGMSTVRASAPQRVQCRQHPATMTWG